MGRPLSELTTYERRKGKEIQARLRRKSGHSQFKTRDLVVEVHRLMEQPYQWPIDLIAQALGLTTRRIGQVLKKQADIEVRATAPTSIEEKYRRMLDWSVDAFETFFNTFSYEGQRKGGMPRHVRDRKSTRLNSSHGSISYAVFCLQNKKVTS